ncbi:MAG: T9SS type A sorting domain-containing protein [Chlorobi bacterium]|nr:T9SS type A sorting domain-containing protein [Chlorobiota bacterium]
MMHKKLKLSTVLLFILGLTGLQAQEAILATGGNASGSGGLASYSVGQLVYSTNNGTNGNSISEGVQQPFEISVVSGIEQAKGINIECDVYPNPTSDFLTIKVDDFNNKNLLYQLFDIKGNLLESERISANENNISMENFVPETYILKVSDNNKEIKTFKIIKH